ncbi:MAG: NADH-quinone oxidoreductase subunit J [Pseudomonadota bacterium]|nr:NADH-quinone oxidoreductase subunit J [Pseudomonadota bacterium]
MTTVGDLLGPGAPWPAVAVVVPLLSAFLATLLGRAAHRVLAPSALVSTAVAAMATAQVATHGTVEVAVGNWAPPLGIVLRADGLSCAFLVAAAVLLAAAAAFARPDLGPAPDGRETRRGFAFWPLVLCLQAGLNAVFVGGDLFNLYVALELLTIPAVALVALDGKPEAVTAAFRYLLFALLGSLAYLLGAAILYATYGALDVRLLGRATGGAGPALVAAAFMTAGLMAKTALFPLHAWLPAAHAAAPAPASALLSALVVKAPFVVLLRLWFEAVPGVATPILTQSLGVLGAGGILLGSVLALRQGRLKLLVAYSTVAQLGYLLLVFPLAAGSGAQHSWTASAWTGVIFHALAHALAKGAMFLSAGAMAQALGHDRLEGLAGLGQKLPISAFAFGLAAVSLMGLPPSGGFTAKYLLLTSAFASGQWWWALVMVVGGLLAAGYLFRALGRLLSKPVEVRIVAQVSRARQATALGLALLSIALGLWSVHPYRLLQIGAAAAAQGLP